MRTTPDDRCVLVTIEAMHDFCSVKDRRVFVGPDALQAAAAWGVLRCDTAKQEADAADPRNADIILFEAQCNVLPLEYA